MKTKYFSSVWLGVSILLTIFGVLVLFKTLIPQCANSLTCEESLKFIVDNDDTAVYNGRDFEPPNINTAVVEDTKVLGSGSHTGDKHIYVDLSTQTLKAYEGAKLFFETKVSTGKHYPTPTGEFTIWKKIRSTKMSGGEGEGYYYLPNVPYVMFFSNSEIAPGRGFGLHGAYWHNNFGHAMSHGCVNMRTIDAKTLYDWVSPVAQGNDTNSTDNNPGTTITIYGKAR